MPWWGRAKDSNKLQQGKVVDREALRATTFDPDKLPPRKPLPKAMQMLVDKGDEELVLPET